ncbi:ABC transporter ATP-binding protein [Lacrimispora saccharolytica]|uniref:Oligopeptide/dipeptide ABC transporter, ATPase subunit n=1 Tax=Lacrimispora saccharolytica (strain ATCC 35040 / DSM 2544 / NRCC 2533 / WM1) TaxID=610130 RepID=D9R379_LACSW|nr:ABC transporter ATP-binding protein [Lacrimispora saccharolytica]ADL04828.1 oligopeptide/dipeptide ABC transporter, ATPase subunit [[Clostridium] saccharolyticum WM1]QRV20961.1 ABC transporter ATP-binding protein [Lacrimispora saccharolytica]
MSRLLEVNQLQVQIKTQHGVVRAVRGISFYLNEQETLAIVGESGSGKSISVKSIMGLLPKNGKITEGSILLEGRDLAKYSERQMQTVRGSDISMIFQDPMTSLNPTMTIGKQIVEILREHRKDMSKAQMKKRALELISLVGISNPEARFHQYPHQLSGGMRQRVVIAVALACDPKILIADEPTTALDVTIQAQILDLMKDLQKKIKTSIIIITHNLGVVANIADRVAVMYGGQLVETAGVRDLFYQTTHPYTKGLLASIPKASLKGSELTAIPGTPPDLMDPPKGCPFAARCPKTMEVCRQYPPEDMLCGEEHHARCWLLDERAKALRE